MGVIEYQVPRCTFVCTGPNCVVSQAETTASALPIDCSNTKLLYSNDDLGAINVAEHGEASCIRARSGNRDPEEVLTKRFHSNG